MIFFDDQLTDTWCLRDALSFLPLQGLAPCRFQISEGNTIAFIWDVTPQNHFENFLQFQKMLPRIINILYFPSFVTDFWCKLH